MTTDPPQVELLEELRLVENEITTLEREIREIREELADHLDGPGDRFDYLQ